MSTASLLHPWRHMLSRDNLLFLWTMYKIPHSSPPSLSSSTRFLTLLPLFPFLSVQQQIFLRKGALPPSFFFFLSSPHPQTVLPISHLFVCACLPQCITLGLDKRLLVLRLGLGGALAVLILTMTSVPSGLTITLFPACEELRPPGSTCGPDTI